jgi:regulatory protein
MSDPIKDSIFRLLANRDHSRQEIIQKLRKKQHAPEAIEAALTTFADSGLLNEHRYAENFIRWRRNRGYGPVRISMELNARGIPHEMIAELLHIADNAWFSEANTAWQKRFGGKHPTTLNERAKQMRFLQYRGFTREHIDQLFRTIKTTIT